MNGNHALLEIGQALEHVVAFHFPGRGDLERLPRVLSVSIQP